MRYIIQHAATDSLHAPAVMTGYAAFIADNHQQAQAMFAEKHPDRTVIKIIPVFDEKAAFSLYGLGAYTEEEQKGYRENLAAKMAETRRELSDIEARLLEYSPEEFTAELDHRARAAEPTPNADGVRLGDIFYTEWGYEQTNIDFYQVVALKGKHTITLRMNEAKSGTASSMTGYTRPIRDAFHPRGSWADPITVRTKTVEAYGRKELAARIENHLLRPVEFNRLYHFTCYA